MFSWLDSEEALSNAALTVRAQTRSPIDQGKFYFPIFFPRVDSRSIKLSEITTLDLRPAADRREWNTRGRTIPLVTPPLKDVEMIPVESNFRIDEYEMQKLLEGANGNETIFRQIVGPSIPTRTDGLVMANLRRLEIDAMKAWATGTITVRNPQGSGADKVVDLQYAADRYTTPTPWTGGTGGTAWAQLLEETYNAQDKIGSVAGCALRLSTFRAIQQSSPVANGTGQTSPISRGELQRRLQEEFGVPFTFNVVEDTHEVFTDGGSARSSVKVWPAHVLAFIPQGGRIGSTFHAPVARAFQMAAQNPAAQIDVAGQVVVKEISNGGRDLQVECQVNALSLPEEQALYVVDTGI